MFLSFLYSLAFFPFVFFFFFNDTATTEIYTLSLHDALPISSFCSCSPWCMSRWPSCRRKRSEEHTSELQSRSDLVCRLLLEKKKKQKNIELQNNKQQNHKTTEKIEPIT